ncbi:MAG: hypothetical protein AAFX78_02620 [Cyanobacteria bacterium J06638_20]
MDRFTKKAVAEHLDHIAKLRVRADLAREMNLDEIADGAYEDVKRRKREVLKLVRRAAA